LRAKNCHGSRTRDCRDLDNLELFLNLPCNYSYHAKICDLEQLPHLNAGVGGGNGKARVGFELVGIGGFGSGGNLRARRLVGVIVVAADALRGIQGAVVALARELQRPRTHVALLRQRRPASRTRQRLVPI